MSGFFTVYKIVIIKIIIVMVCPLEFLFAALTGPELTVVAVFVQ